MTRLSSLLILPSLLLLLGACTGTPSSTEGTTSAGTTGGGGQGAGPSNGGAGGSGGSAGGAPPDLVDRGLVLRYFIDEAASGTAPAELSDAAPDPLPLELSYDGNVAFGERDGQRGLIFTAVDQQGHAAAPIAATKVLARLAGSTTATIEAVVALDEVTTSPSRILNIGEGSQTGELTLSAPLLDRIYLYWHGYSRIGAFLVDLGPARVVVHAVVDSTAAPGLRTRAYGNGSPLARIGGEVPPDLSAIELDGDEEVVIGNRPTSYRSPDGAVLYVALYDVVLDESEILHNAARLIASDDAAPPADSP